MEKYIKEMMYAGIPRRKKKVWNSRSCVAQSAQMLLLCTAQWYEWYGFNIM